MQMDEEDARSRLLAPVTEQISDVRSGSPMRLGHRSIEKIYENALAHEMRKCGLGVVQQRDIVVYDDDMIDGDYTADLLAQGGRR